MRGTHFQKIHFRKIYFGKVHFGKIHFGKIHFRKIHFQKIYFQKKTFGNYTFREKKLFKNKHRQKCPCSNFWRKKIISLFQHHWTTFTFLPSLNSYDGFYWEAIIHICCSSSSIKYDSIKYDADGWKYQSFIVVLK